MKLVGVKSKTSDEPSANTDDTKRRVEAEERSERRMLGDETEREGT